MLIPIVSLLVVSNVVYSEVVDTQKNDTQTSKEVVQPVSKDPVQTKPVQPSVSTSAPSEPKLVNPTTKTDGSMYANHQGENTSDVKITQAVRKALIADNSLSNYAKNVQVITNNGVVLLKGFVANQDESAKVGSIVSKTPGVKSVKNELKVNQK